MQKYGYVQFTQNYLHTLSIRDATIMWRANLISGLENIS